MLAALFFSYSRGAWVGVAAALGVTALLALVRSKRAATLAIVLGLIALIVVGLGEINLVPEHYQRTVRHRRRLFRVRGCARRARE